VNLRQSCAQLSIFPDFSTALTRLARPGGPEFQAGLCAEQAIRTIRTARTSSKHLPEKTKVTNQHG